MRRLRECGSDFASFDFLLLNFYFLFMQELLDQLKAEGLTDQQALRAVEIIKNFAKKKFPVFSGAIEKVFEKYSPKDQEDFLD